MRETKPPPGAFGEANPVSNKNFKNTGEGAITFGNIELVSDRSGWILQDALGNLAGACDVVPGGSIDPKDVVFTAGLGFLRVSISTPCLGCTFPSL